MSIIRSENVLNVTLQVGLLREKTPEDEASANNSNSASSPFPKDSYSPFKEIMQTMERPPTADFSSPPRSADYYKKPSFFQVTTVLNR